MVNQGLQVSKEIVATVVQKEDQEQWELKVNKVLMVYQELKEIREAQGMLVNKAGLVLGDLEEQLANQEKQGILDHRVTLVMMDDQAMLVLLEFQASKVPWDSAELEELRVQ